jgi:hypothetical protein
LTANVAGTPQPFLVTDNKETDGQRFLINSVVGGAEPSTLNVVLHWQSALSR